MILQLVECLFCMGLTHAISCTTYGPLSLSGEIPECKTRNNSEHRGCGTRNQSNICIFLKNHLFITGEIVGEKALALLSMQFSPSTTYNLLSTPKNDP